MTVERRPEAVLFITGWWPTEADPHNGVFIREHALALATATPVVVVHLSVVKRKWGLLKFKWQESSDQGLQVIHGEIQTPVRRGGWHDRIVRSAYRKAILKYSDRYRFRVMHIHNRTPITENASFVGEEMGLPVVVTEHSSFYHLWIHHLGAEVGSQTRERIINWFARPSIRAVLPVSRDLGRVLQDDFDVAKEKIHVVPNVASPIFKPAASEHVPPFRILLAARWSAPKDPFLFIDALHLLPVGVRNSLHVDWVGDGDQIEQARAACAAFITDGIMHFRGRLPKTELAPLLAKAHLLVHPTKAENLPCIIIESLCCGTPVLSTTVNGIPELVDRLNGVLTPPEDPQAFADALRWIMDNYRGFDRPAIARAADARYSAAAVARQFLDVYEQITS